MIQGEELQNTQCDTNHQTNIHSCSNEKIFCQFSETRSLPSNYYECSGQLLRDDNIFNDILEETGRETLKITLDIQHKDHKEINKQFQATLMNYYLESYISPLLIQHMGLMYKREVFRKMKELAEKQMAQKQKKYIVLMNLFCQKIEQSEQTKEYVNILFEAILKPSPNPDIPQLEYCTFYRQRLCALILLQHYYTINRDSEYQNFYCFWHKLFENQFPILQYIMEDKQLRKKLRMNTGIRVQAVPSLRNYMHKKQSCKNNAEEKANSTKLTMTCQKSNGQKNSKLHSSNKENLKDEKIYKTRINNQGQPKKLLSSKQIQKTLRKKQKINRNLKDDLLSENNQQSSQELEIENKQKNTLCHYENQVMYGAEQIDSDPKKQKIRKQDLSDQNEKQNQQNKNIQQTNDQQLESKNRNLKSDFKDDQPDNQKQIGYKLQGYDNKGKQGFTLEKLAKKSKPRCSIEAAMLEQNLQNDNEEGNVKSERKINQSQGSSSTSIISSSDLYLKTLNTGEKKDSLNEDYDKSNNQMLLSTNYSSQILEQRDEISQNLSTKEYSKFKPLKNQIQNDLKEEKQSKNKHRNIILIQNQKSMETAQENRDRSITEQYYTKDTLLPKSCTMTLKSEEQIADQSQLFAQNSFQSAAYSRKNNIFNSKMSEETTLMNSPQINKDIFSFQENAFKEESQKGSQLKLSSSFMSQQNYFGQNQFCVGNSINQPSAIFAIQPQSNFYQQYPQVSSLQVQNQLYSPAHTSLATQNDPTPNIFEQAVLENMNWNQTNAVNKPNDQTMNQQLIKEINNSQDIAKVQIMNQYYQQQVGQNNKIQYDNSLQQFQQQQFYNNYLVGTQYQPIPTLNDNPIMIQSPYVSDNSKANGLNQNKLYYNLGASMQNRPFGQSINDFQQMLLNNQQCYFRSQLPNERAFAPQNHTYYVIHQIQL